MFAPMYAKKVSTTDGYRPGVCEFGSPDHIKRGIFVPYRRVKQYFNGYEAVVELNVQDINSTYSGFLPFFIDTGADVTMIPRSLLKNHKNAFVPTPDSQYLNVEGLTGRIIVGIKFPAVVSTPKIGMSPPITFGDQLEILIVEDLPGDLAVIGLDALRNVIMVSDDQYVTIWPREFIDGYGRPSLPCVRRQESEKYPCPACSGR